MLGQKIIIVRCRVCYIGVWLQPCPEKLDASKVACYNSCGFLYIETFDNYRILHREQWSEFMTDDEFEKIYSMMSSPKSESHLLAGKILKSSFFDQAKKLIKTPQK
jgi:hypothetical protein